MNTQKRQRSKSIIQFITIHLAMAYLLVMPFSFSVQALEAPSAPSAPSSPEAPEEPDSPEAPEAPKAPTYGDKEEVEEDSSETSNDSEKTETSDAEKSSSSESTDKETTSELEEEDTPIEAQTVHDEEEEEYNGVGDSEIETGDATSTLNATTTANTNTASTPTSNGGDQVDLTNAGNGSDTDNENTVNLSDKDTSVQVNDADIVNAGDVDSNTGDNDNSRNVGNTTTNTGDANTSATIITTANTNADGIQANEFNIVEDHVGDIVLDTENPCSSGCEAGDVIVIKNADNGSDSDNKNEVTVQDKDETFQYNDADVENDLVMSSDSGNNTSNDNTGGDTVINTGDANTSANVASFLNNNVAGEVVINTVNVFGDLVGNIVAPEATSGDCGTCEAGSGSTEIANTGNGSNSTNQNEFSQGSEDLVYQNNDAEITNSVKLDTNTGDNSSSANTGGNTNVETGETNVDVNVMNIANQNVSGDWWIVLVNQAGQWVGQIMGAPEGASMAGSEGTQFIVHDDGSIDIVNENNGSGSENTNTVNSSTSKTVVQDNQANLHNNLDLSANTGGNSASRNTGGTTTINTGDANIVANLVNFVNNNITGGGKVNVTIVNVFGSWIGDFVGPGQKARQAAQADHSNTSEANKNNKIESEAVGGYIQEEYGSNEEDKEEIASTTEEDSTVVTRTRSFLGRAQTNSQVGETSLEAEGKVLGVEAEAEVLATSSEETINGEYQAESGSQKQPLKIKVGWPALITSLLGMVYAGFKARYFFV